jgi:hypothetical protein
MRASEDVPERLGAALLGLALLISAGLCGDLAREHMAMLERICGADSAAAHCGWCYAAAGFAVAGLLVLAGSARPLTARARVSRAPRGRRSGD